jgi:hypothetical protein
MSRVMLPLCAVIGVLAIAVAGAPRDVAEAAPNATLTIQRAVLHCDGDATRITVHGELADGTVLANLPVFLSGGTFKSRYGTVVSNTYPASVPSATRMPTATLTRASLRSPTAWGAGT